MSLLPVTPSQTVGPFFAYGLTARQYGYDYSSLLDAHLVDPEHNPEAQIQITGRVFDGNGVVIPDALIELWQPTNPGDPQRTQPQLLEYPAQPASFKGYGRLGTGTTTDNRFTFTTVKPVGKSSGNAPHINVIVLMRGSLRTLYTRLYFADEDNSQDGLLSNVPSHRQQTLIAQPIGNGQYLFDIRMQGEGETVFFDL